jgi:putative two-component system response regulator
VLGVDDHPRNLAILRKILASEFHLLTAATGEEALQVATGFRPDLVLLDVMMPGINGYETCRRPRHRHRGAPTSSPSPRR